MKKAEEAKQASTDNFIKVFEEQYKSLLTAVEQRIDDAINKAEKNIKVTFPRDRFTKPVIDAVVAKLKELGYNTNYSEYNAMQTFSLDVNWKQVK